MQLDAWKKKQFLNADNAILKLINNNGVVWTTEGDNCSSIDFGVAC